MRENEASPPLVVVALGGNAIQDPEGDDSVASDFARTKVTARRLVELAVGGPCRLVITHGNGPQVGNHLLRSELAHEAGRLPDLPLDVCVADTQGGMGYMLQQCLGEAFHEAGVSVAVAALVTQTVVDEHDPAFTRPSKPVGHVIHDLERVQQLREEGWALAEDAHRGGWRRVVASPDPKEIVEAAAIEAMVADGIVVIAAGGGGIPVTQDDQGILTGIPSVVDKDLASALLAIDLRAHALVILTDVDKVKLDYDSDHESDVDAFSVAEARAHLRDGQFPAGSMGPKVEAVCRFVEVTGGRGVIGPIARSSEALSDDFGTVITP